MSSEEDFSELDSYTYSSQSYFDSYFETLSNRSTNNNSAHSSHKEDEDTDESFRKSPRTTKCAKVQVHRRVHVHSKWKVAKRSFLFGILICLPLCIPFFMDSVRQLQQKTAAPVVYKPIELPQPKHTVVVNNIVEQQAKTGDPLLIQDVEQVVEGLLQDKIHKQYETRNNFVNIASDRAGALIFNLYCPAENSRSLFSSLFGSTHAQIDLARCKNPQSLINQGDKGWNYYGKLGMVHIEFANASRVFSFGLELYKWDLRNQIQAHSQVVVYGVKHENLRHPWDNAETGAIDLKEEIIAEFKLDEYDERSDNENKSRLYFVCKSRSCGKVFRGIRVEFNNKAPIEDANSISKLFVYEMF